MMLRGERSTSEEIKRQKYPQPQEQDKSHNALQHEYRLGFESRSTHLFFFFPHWRLSLCCWYRFSPSTFKIRSWKAARSHLFICGLLKGILGIVGDARLLELEQMNQFEKKKCGFAQDVIWAHLHRVTLILSSVMNHQRVSWRIFISAVTPLYTLC